MRKYVLLDFETANTIEIIKANEFSILLLIIFFVLHFISYSKGNISELHCTYDPETKGGNAPDGRKVKATLHWVSANHAMEAEVRLYDRLFKVQSPDAEDNFIDTLNPDSLMVMKDCKLEPALAEAEIGAPIQFERLGYFCKDIDSNKIPIFNRTVPLRDAWAKIEKQNQSGQKK